MSIPALILLIFSIISNLYQLTAALCGLFFSLRPKPDTSGNKWPRVSCLKPLCGDDPELTHNLKSFLNQDYSDYEVVFGTASKDDSAYNTACLLSEENSHKNIRAVSGEKGRGANRKVRNLQNIEAHLSPSTEMIVLSDSDVRVTEKYLKHVIAPLRNDASVGAVTCLYRIEQTKTVADIIEALSVESTFVPGVLVSSTFSQLKYAFGASIALRKSDFDKTGGLAAIANYLADDYKIGNMMYQSGKRVVLSPYVVSIIAQNQSLKKTLARLIRWNHTIKQSQPVGYFFFIITNSTLWTLAAFCALGPSLIGWTLLGTGLFIRIFSAATVTSSIGSKKGIKRAFLSPLWDILSSTLWFIGFIVKRVTWRGITYKLFSDGQMAEMK